MTRLRSVSALWALAGSALIIWSIYGAVTELSEFGFMAGAFTAAVIATVFGLLALAGSILTLRERRPGRNLLRAVSVVAVLYGVVFFLFGREERGLMYAFAVGGLLLLGVASLVVLTAGVSRGA
jgi:hypothetical protein